MTDQSEQPHECPYIVRDEQIDTTFNAKRVFITHCGARYIYYEHDNGFGETTLVQFCKLIGRKKDVFECLNEGEWHACYAYRSGLVPGWRRSGDEEPKP